MKLKGRFIEKKKIRKWNLRNLIPKENFPEKWFKGIGNALIAERKSLNFRLSPLAIDQFIAESATEPEGHRDSTATNLE